jgi:hypothetical protein
MKAKDVIRIGRKAEPARFNSSREAVFAEPMGGFLNLSALFSPNFFKNPVLAAARITEPLAGSGRWGYRRCAETLPQRD